MDREITVVVTMKSCSVERTSGCLNALHSVLRRINASFEISEGRGGLDEKQATRDLFPRDNSTVSDVSHEAKE